MSLNALVTALIAEASGGVKRSRSDGFTALSFGWFPAALLLQRILGRKRYAAWQRAQDAQAGFDGRRALRLMGFAIMIPYTLLFLPSLVCHTRFSVDEIGIQRYGDLREKRYRHGDISKVAVIRGFRDRSGVFHEDEQLIVDFRDGQRWRSGDSFRDPEEVDPNLAAFLVLKTNLAYQYAETEKDLK